MRKKQILETERLVLRPFRAGDFDDYAALFADPEVTRYLSRVQWNRDQAWLNLAFQVGHWKLLGYGMWAAVERETGAFVGRIGFAEPEGWPGCELAWALAPRFWGRGYATEGARAALDYAFTVLGKNRVISLIHPENDASLRVAGRLGETLQGRTDHTGREMLIYGIERPERPLFAMLPQPCSSTTYVPMERAVQSMVKRVFVRGSEMPVSS
ncbi:MAG TPA: GNAT family N-acetyltransferase [Thermoanaerobaculia bacterium]|jgi:RimJ/RimL family protein N-acetyltransferase|nr:GNAT family N-acetyltransferase [Thermoanaerobaculia bacterium]